MNFKTWLKHQPGQYLPATPENIALAKQFLLEKWRERATQNGYPPPEDLSSACKFGSMFASKIFGGKIRGNYHHQYVVLGKQIIDMTDAAGVPVPNPHYHDRSFFGNPEHRESMETCIPRVDQWVAEFPQWLAQHAKG